MTELEALRTVAHLATLHGGAGGPDVQERAKLAVGLVLALVDRAERLEANEDARHRLVIEMLAWDGRHPVVMVDVDDVLENLQSDHQRPAERIEALARGRVLRALEWVARHGQSTAAFDAHADEVRQAADRLSGPAQ